MGKDLRGKELGIGISQQKDGLYVGRFVNRSGKRVTKRFKKLQECRKWISDAEFENEHNDINALGDMTVDAWYEYWMSIKEKTVRFNTCRNHKERYTNDIKPIIGKLLLSEVKPLHCQAIFNAMAEHGYANSTIEQCRITLHNLFEVAKDNDIILSNPCRKSVKSNIGRTTEKREALTIEEQKALVRLIKNHQFANQFLFVLQTGLRVGELIGLKWSDIDFKNKTMTIKRTMEYRYNLDDWRVGEPKSETGRRVVPLTDEAIAILNNQREKNASLKVIPLEWKDQVFLGRNGYPKQNSCYAAALYRLSEKAGVKKTSMHILRHTFATRCIEAGMKPKTLQIILGHSNISITMNLYVHITEEQKSKEIDMVADALKVI